MDNVWQYDIITLSIHREKTYEQEPRPANFPEREQGATPLATCPKRTDSAGGAGQADDAYELHGGACFQRCPTGACRPSPLRAFSGALGGVLHGIRCPAEGNSGAAQTSCGKEHLRWELKNR